MIIITDADSLRDAEALDVMIDALRAAGMIQMLGTTWSGSIERTMIDLKQDGQTNLS
jgi:hypothetical protein